MYSPDRRPIVWNNMNECDREHVGKMCDYQEFRNQNGDKRMKQFEVRTANEFDLRMISLWDNLLKL